MTDIEDDESHIQFFAQQKDIQTRAAKGRYRAIKWWVMGIGMLLYYLTPFLQWDRGADAPSQAVLLDMVHRRGYFFMFEIWPQEVYYLTGILILAALFLFFSTALFGRIWCGYLCFQTVWSDLFRLVEHALQGDRNERMRRDAERKWSFSWMWRKVLTHILWVVIAAFTSGAFVLYFNDAREVVHSLVTLQPSTGILIAIGGLTFSTYLMAGYAREQVCTFMCPYARFQSGMFDEHSLIISYDALRGEPRAPRKKGHEFGDKGHCIDCSLCVQVCPMGIDIRNGLQLECIACGLCVDACNSVMDKLELPRGLVRYDTPYNIKARKEGRAEMFKFIRPRTIYYAIIVSLVAGVMLYGQLTRAPFELHLIHDRNPLFVTLSDGSVRNGYDVKVLNKTHMAQDFALAVEGLDGAKMDIQFGGEADGKTVKVAPDSVGKVRVFITAPEQKTAQAPFRFKVTRGDGLSDDHKTTFVSRMGD